MNFKVELDEETRKILNDFLKEFKILNENLYDLKVMTAPLLGFKVKGEK